MEKETNELYQILQDEIGLYRQMLELVRVEKQALLDANLKKVQEATDSKEVLLHSLSQTEKNRLIVVGSMALILKRPVSDLKLKEIILIIQGTLLEKSNQLQSLNNALTVLVSRIVEQNKENQSLAAGLLTHLKEMKKNVLGEGMIKTDVYSANMQKVASNSGGRLMNQEV